MTERRWVKMPAVSVYVYSDQQIEAIVAKARRRRTIFMAVSVVVLAFSILYFIYFPDSALFRKPADTWVIAFLTSGFLLPLVKNIRTSRTWADQLREKTRKTRVEISSAAVTVDGPLGNRHLWRSEIIRAEEPLLGTGLCLRTGNRYRWALIPGRLDSYDQIKHELEGTGINIATTFMAANWEEYAGMLLFIGIIVCSFLARDLTILTANFISSVLLAAAMFYVVNRSSDSLHETRWAKFGAFLPAVFAAVALWSALHP